MGWVPPVWFLLPWVVLAWLDWWDWVVLMVLTDLNVVEGGELEELRSKDELSKSGAGCASK